MPATPTAALGIHDQLRAAFQIESRPERWRAVLSLLPAFLDDLARRPSDDQAASTLLTDIAFASGRMTYTDPAYIRRADDLTIVGLPDAMGLYMISRVEGVSQTPIEISRWTAGLDSLDVVRHNQEIGALYTTLGVDGTKTAHYALLRASDIGWGVIWLAGNDPDWWFNAANAAVALSPDLARITLVGDAQGTTSVFREGANTPQRRFRISWARDKDAYAQFPAMGGSDNRQNWLWQIAEPSAYATLVEFLERLRIRDDKGAAMLVTDPAVVDTARSFGLHFPENSYTVTFQDDQRIAFQGRQGAFVSTFQPPAPGSPPEQDWLIIDIEPAGAAPPYPSAVKVRKSFEHFRQRAALPPCG